MRRFIIHSGLAGVCLAGLMAFSFAAQAQPASTPSDTERAVRAAEQAAHAAEVAAAAATEAAQAARQAAEAAVAARLGAQQVNPDENQPISAFVQTESPTPVRTRAEEQRHFSDAIQESVANGPSYRSHKTTGSPEFQLVASDDTKVASIALTMDVSGMPSEGGNNLNSTMLTVTASTELAKSGFTNFGDLSGLAAGTEVKLNLTHYESRFDAENLDLTAVDAAEAACRKAAKESGVPSECRASKFPGGATEFVMTYNRDAVREFVNNVLPGPIVFYGIEAKAGQANFSYLDQPTFTLQEKSRFSFSGTLFAGAIVNSGNTSLSGSFTWARQRKAQDPITLCQAINAIPQTQCITAAGGPPKLKERAIIGAEIRHAFAASMGEFAKFAIAPQFSYDFVSDAYGVDVPFYLVGDGKGKLRGGFRVGYANQRKTGGGRDEDVTLGVFLGVPFSVFR